MLEYRKAPPPPPPAAPAAAPAPPPRRPPPSVVSDISIASSAGALARQATSGAAITMREHREHRPPPRPAFMATTPQLTSEKQLARDISLVNQYLVTKFPDLQHAFRAFKWGQTYRHQEAISNHPQGQGKLTFRQLAEGIARFGLPITQAQVAKIGEKMGYQGEGDLITYSAFSKALREGDTARSGFPGS